MRLLIATLLLAGCDDTTFGAGGDEVVLDGPSCDSEANSQAFVVQKLDFAEAEDGVVWGFDLDGLDSDVGDSKGCGKQDFVDPEGNTGIDNAFAQIFPAIENTEAAAVHELMQNAINDGELLLVAEVLGLDDPMDDDCVTVRFGSAEGTPMMGTDGYLLDGQSFTPKPGLTPSLTETTEIVDGQLIARGLEVNLDLRILDVTLAMAVQDGMIRMDFDPESNAVTGHFGGGFSTAYVVEVLANSGVDDAVSDLLSTALPLAADLDGPDGECTDMSVDLEFTAVPAFYYED